MQNVRNLMRNRMLQVTITLFVILTFWWLLIHPFNKEVFVYQKNIWSSIYFVLAILGGFYGLLISKHFDGSKSLLGKIVLAFSIGLFLQSFGQIAYDYYLWFKKIETPYPSLGDVGYFGSILAYIYGVFILARYIGVTISIRSFLDKTLAIIIPLGILALSYFFLLRGYEFDWSNKLKIFLDFGYPFGQAIYISIAILVFIFSRNFLGGVMKKPIMFLLVALGIQYFSDFIFLYQSNNGIYTAGNVVDFIYLISYFLMTLAIIYIGNIFQQINLENSTVSDINLYRDTSNDELFNQILVGIIKRQVRIAGNVAWQEVKKIPEIVVLDEAVFKISIIGDPKKVIDQLLQRYKNLFGYVAIRVSRNAVYNLTTKLSMDLVPDNLK